MQSSLFIFIICLIFLPLEARTQIPFSVGESSIAKYWTEQVDEASSVDELVVASLFAETHQLNAHHWGFLQAALAHPQNNSFAYEIAINTCNEAANWHGCKKEAFINKLLALSPNNINSYLYLVVYKYEVGLKTEALNALKKAVIASFFKDSFFSSSNRVLNTLRSIGYPESHIRFRAAQYFGAGWGAFSSYGQMISICKSESESSEEWRAMCLSLGEKIFNSGSTFLATRAGLAIQKATLTASNTSIDKINEVERLRNYTHYWREYAVDKLDFLKGEGSPDYPPDYFERAVNQGEIDAISNALMELQGDN